MPPRTTASKEKTPVAHYCCLTIYPATMPFVVLLGPPPHKHEVCTNFNSKASLFRPTHTDSVRIRNEPHTFQRGVLVLQAIDISSIALLRSSKLHVFGQSFLSSEKAMLFLSGRVFSNSSFETT